MYTMHTPQFNCYIHPAYFQPKDAPDSSPLSVDAIKYVVLSPLKTGPMAAFIE